MNDNIIPKLYTNESMNSDNDESVCDNKPSMRYFNVIDKDGNKCGRYAGISPKQAAMKAYDKMVDDRRTNNETMAPV